MSPSLKDALGNVRRSLGHGQGSAYKASHGQSLGRGITTEPPSWEETWGGNMATEGCGHRHSCQHS